MSIEPEIPLTGGGRSAVSRIGLPFLADRARKLRTIVDGYGLATDERARLVPTMIELALAVAANGALQAGLTPDSTGPGNTLWGAAWRARSAGWTGLNKEVLEACLGAGTAP